MANQAGGGAFDSETITLLASVLDRVWSSNTPEQETEGSRGEIAGKVLMLAMQGERNAAHLFNTVLAHFTKQAN